MEITKVWTIETWPVDQPLPKNDTFQPYGGFEKGSAPLMTNTSEPFPGTGTFRVRKSGKRFRANGFYLTKKGTYRNKVTRIE